MPATAGILYLRGDLDKIGSSHPATVGILGFASIEGGFAVWLGPGCGCFVPNSRKGRLKARARV
jgi:hypothetical protein